MEIGHIFGNVFSVNYNYNDYKNASIYEDHL